MSEREIAVDAVVAGCEDVARAACRCTRCAALVPVDGSRRLEKHACRFRELLWHGISERLGDGPTAKAAYHRAIEGVTA